MKQVTRERNVTMLDVRSCQREQGGPKSPKGRFCDKNADRNRGMTLGALEKK